MCNLTPICAYQQIRTLTNRHIFLYELHPCDSIKANYNPRLVWGRGGGVRRGKNFNFTPQKVNKLNFGDFPLHCIPTCALGKKNMEDAIKGQEEEEMEKKRETKGGKKDGGRKKK